MKYIKHIGLGILLSTVFLYGYSQPRNYGDCEPLGDFNKYLWLNGTNQTLIDNALRCFQLSSIGTYGDSCTRIWIYDDNSQGIPRIFRVKLFEFGTKNKKKYATYNTLEWQLDKLDSLVVGCIKKKEVNPSNGWTSFDLDMHKLKFERIDTIPYEDSGDGAMVSIGMSVLQYIFETKSITLDFTSNMANIKYERVRKFIQLIRLIEKEFLIKLLASENMHDSKIQTFKS